MRICLLERSLGGRTASLLRREIPVRPSVPASTGGAIGERWVIVHHNGFWTFLANVPGVNFVGVERM